MHIEIFKGRGKQKWRWHKKNRGRITCSAEGFPSRSHAVRAAQADVRQTTKQVVSWIEVTFDQRFPGGGVTRMTWS